MRTRDRKLFQATAAIAFAVALVSSCFVPTGSSQTTGNTVVSVHPSTNSPSVGEMITVAIRIENVDNLYGLDVSLSWNATVLHATSVTLNLGVESHSDGVLHGTRLNYDEDTLTPGDIFVQEDALLEGEYDIVATSTNPSSSFNGSGTIATLTFNVTNVGHSDLQLTSELAVLLPGATSANLIEPNDVSASIDSRSPTEPPENAGDLTLIITVLIVLFVIVAVSGTLIYLRKRPKKNTVQQP